MRVSRKKVEQAKALINSYEKTDDQEMWAYQGAQEMADLLLGPGWEEAGS